EDPLGWWQANAVQFPGLTPMVCNYLGIPAMSVLSEQLFSVAREVMKAQRNRLDGDTVQAIMLLLDWWSSDSHQFCFRLSQETLVDR
ncbi:hypothetical protein M427DRAFT_101829, partial [Gonapodya prolifera JEL478]